MIFQDVLCNFTDIYNNNIFCLCTFHNHSTDTAQ
nr:MAG TPA: hypothetical protein [Caudoviricetes sp.]